MKLVALKCRLRLHGYRCLREDKHREFVQEPAGPEMYVR